MVGFITEQGLQQLHSYKYNSSPYSPMDNFLNPYWLLVTELMPRWLAPNLITLLGLIVLLLSATLSLSHDSSLLRDIPNWVFLFAAIANWAYSTLDAVDGKQARRTGSSSPLGHLFDHGCDSIATVIIMMVLAHALKLGTFPTLLLIMASEFTFQTASWKEKKTGVLLTSIGPFGVNEGILLGVVLHLITFIKGQGFWQISLAEICSHDACSAVLRWYPDIKLGGVPAALFSAVILLASLYHIARGIVSDLNTFKQFLGFFTIVALQLIWFFYFEEFEAHQGIIYLKFGLLVGLVISKTIICSVTKMPIPTYHSEVLPSIVLTIVMFLLGSFNLSQGQLASLWVHLVIIAIVSLNFFKGVIEQITKSLGIYCFSLNKRPKTT